MTQPDIDLITGEIRAHAGRLDGQAELIYEAHGAASHVAMQDDAYGQICSRIIVPLLNIFENHAVESIKATATSVESVADLLRVLADSTDVTDEIAGNRLRGGN